MLKTVEVEGLAEYQAERLFSSSQKEPRSVTGANFESYQRTQPMRRYWTSLVSCCGPISLHAIADMVARITQSRLRL